MVGKEASKPATEQAQNDKTRNPSACGLAVSDERALGICEAGMERRAIWSVARGVSTVRGAGEVGSEQSYK